MPASPRRRLAAFLVPLAALASAVVPAVAAAAPSLVATSDTTNLPLAPTTTDVSVNGSGFATNANGVYLFYGPTDAVFSTPTVAAVDYIPAAAMPGGSFTRTITVQQTGGSGDGAFDCRVRDCAIRTIAAHRDTDPTQRTAVPITFGAAIVASPLTDLDRTATTPITVSGTGFDPSVSALYVFYGPEGVAFNRNSGGVKRLTTSGVPTAATDKLNSDGSFSTTIDVSATFGTGETGFTCLGATPCAIQTAVTPPASAETQTAQKTSRRLTFKPAPVAEPASQDPVTTNPAPDPGPSAAAAPVATPTSPSTPVTTPEPAPKLSKVKVAGKKLSFRVTQATTVTAKVQRRVVKRVKGKRKVTWKTVRTIERDVRKAGTYKLNPKLGKGRFKITLRVVGATGRKGKTVVVQTSVK